MLAPNEILEALHGAGASVWVAGDKLLVEPRSKVPPELVPEIRRCKSAIMALLPKEHVDLPFPLGNGGLDSVQVDLAERVNTRNGVTDAIDRKLNLLWWMHQHDLDLGHNQLAQELKTAYYQLRPQATDVAKLVKIGEFDEAVLLKHLLTGQKWLTEFNDELGPEDEDGATKLQKGLDRWCQMEEQLRQRHSYVGCIHGDGQQCPVAVLVSCDDCKAESAIRLVGTE